MFFIEFEELRWYDSSHILPPLAVEEATNWLLAGLAGKQGTRQPVPQPDSIA